MTTTDTPIPAPSEPQPAVSQPTTLDDVADELNELYGLVTRIAERRPSPWPWIAVSVMWSAVVLLAAVLVRYLPDAAWSDGHGWIIFLAVLVAGVCTYKLITRKDQA